jgi:hypothetical protein
MLPLSSLSNAKYYTKIGCYSYYDPKSNVKAMLGKTYKTRNGDEKHENRKTRTGTFSAFTVPKR